MQPALPSSREPYGLADIGLFLLVFVFLFVIFIGFNPFPYAAIKDVDVAETGGGDLLRQIFVTTIFLVCCYQLNSHGKLKEVFWMFSPLIIITLGWCLLSLSWSAAPFIGFRRFVLLILIMFSIFSFITVAGAERFLRWMAYFLAGCMILSVISIPFVPGARHQISGFGDLDLVGTWRGVFSHKNTAGATAVVFLFLSNYILSTKEGKRRKVFWWLSTLCTLVLLVGTMSKTSMGLFIPSLATGWAFSRMSATHASRKFFVACVVSVFLLMPMLIYLFWDLVADILQDPAAFTGRTNLWNLLLEVIAERPWLGWGYQSVWSVGLNTPVLGYSQGAWVLVMPHGHNGYLDLTATIGLIGMVLAVLAFLVQPICAAALQHGVPIPLAQFAISALVFGTFHNFTEGTLLGTIGSSWTMLLVAIGVVRYYTLHPTLKS